MSYTVIYSSARASQGWYVLRDGHTSLAEVPRWVHDGSWDRGSVIPDPALDWIDGPYATRGKAISAETARLAENAAGQA